MIQKINIKELESTVESTQSIYITSIVPIGLKFVTFEEQNAINLNMLCRSSDNQIIILSSLYSINTVEDEEFIMLNPLLDSKCYINHMLAENILLESVPNYVSNLHFEFVRPAEYTDKNTAIFSSIYCNAISTDTSKTICRIDVTPQVYSVINYLSNYIISGITSNTELYDAILYGYKEDKNLQVTEINIDGSFAVFGKHGLDIAIIKKLKNETILAVHCMINDIRTDEWYPIILPIVVDYKIKKSNLVSMDSFIQNYNSGNVYLNKYYSWSNLDSEFKKYFIIKATNSNYESKLVFINEFEHDVLLKEIHDKIAK